MICVILTKGLHALVDSDDAWVLDGPKWVASKSGKRFYVVRKRNGKREYLHRLLCNNPAGMTVDHIDGDTMNNYRSNLRVCSQQENAWNSSKRSEINPYKGLIWTPHISKWSARIMKDGKPYHLGVFVSPEDAAIAYNNAAVTLFGEFAKVNVIESNTTQS
jgi:hypothetical protein